MVASILDEVHEARRKIFEEAGNDPHGLFRRLREAEKKHPERVVELPRCASIDVPPRTFPTPEAQRGNFVEFFLGSVTVCRRKPPKGKLDSRSAEAFLFLVPIWDSDIISTVRIISVSTLKAFLSTRPEYADAREPVMAWSRQVRKADWANPATVKRDMRNASVLKDGRVVFNIAGNKYRIVVWINYPYRVVYIRFIGTHRTYDTIDAQTI